MGKKKKRLYYKENFANYSVLLPWNMFKEIMVKDFGFEMGNKNGSTRAFTRDGIVLTFDEPHGKGDKYVHKGDREKAIRWLRGLGLLEEAKK